MRNNFEKRIRQLLKRRKLKFEYETEKLPYVITGNYIPDFIVHTPNGKVYIETKGYLREQAKIKMVAVKKQHPDIDLRIVFYSHKKKDIKWAEKHNIPYAIDTIPKEWFDV